MPNAFLFYENLCLLDSKQYKHYCKLLSWSAIAL